MEKYKLSKYNLIFNHDGKTIIYNSLSNILAELDDTTINILNAIKTNSYSKNFFLKNHEAFKCLKNYLIILLEDKEELEIIKERYYTKENNYLHLILAPTLKCNFNCFYCYEEKNNIVMSEDIKEKILKLIENNAKMKRNISIDWYGGEPMIEKDFIFSISKLIVEICEKNCVTYTSNMITNGYLITNEDLLKFKQSNIRSFQITVDGNQDIHNQRRVFSDGRDSYNKIIENITMLIKNKFYVKVRINIDKENYLNNSQLLNDLSNIDDQYLTIRFGKLKDFNCEKYCGNKKYFSTEEFSKIFCQKQVQLYEYGFLNSARAMYPQLKRNRCVADAINSFVIGPFGEVYNCISDVGIKSQVIGYIQDYQMEKNIIKSPFENEQCKNCFCLPICMGSCPKDMNQERAHCEIWRYNIKEIIKNHYIYNIDS